MITDWKLCTDEKEKYQAYLCSSEWWSLRNKVVERCDGICEKCRIRKVEHVHHLTYIRKYAERLSDLLGVCKKCHDGIHNPTRNTVVFKDPLQPAEIELFEIAFNESSLLSEVLETAEVFKLLQTESACNAFFRAMDPESTDHYSQWRRHAAVGKLAFLGATPIERLRMLERRLRSCQLMTNEQRIQKLSMLEKSREEMDSLLQQVLEAARNR